MGLCIYMTENILAFLWRALPVEVVHGVTGIAGNLIETLSSAYRLLNSILIIQNFIIWRRKGRLLTRSWPDWATLYCTYSSTLPFMVTLTPEARKRPPKRLLKIWLPSSVAVAWLVISIPGNEKSAMSKGRVQIKRISAPINLTCCEAIKNAVLA